MCVVRVVQVKPGTGDIGLHDARVHWQLDHATVMEMIDKRSALKDGNSPSLRRHRFAR